MIWVDRYRVLVSRDMDLGGYQKCITLVFLRPEEPTDNALIEAFNSKSRLKYFNAVSSLSLADVCEKLERWRRFYNEDRPNSSVGDTSPIALANSGAEPAHHAEDTRRL